MDYNRPMARMKLSHYLDDYVSQLPCFGEQSQKQKMEFEQMDLELKKIAITNKHAALIALYGGNDAELKNNLNECEENSAIERGYSFVDF